MADSKHSQELPGPGTIDSLAARGMAHDVNQLLGVVLGRAQMLLEQAPDPELKRHLDLMVLAARDAEVLLNGYLDSGNRGSSPDISDAQAETVNLYRVVDHCQKMMLDRLQAISATTGKQIVLKNEIATDLQTLVPGVLIREVLNNVVINAAEAMPDGGVISVSGEQTASGRVTLSIRDQGQGMTAEILARCCEPGFSTGKSDGHGLGLANCRRLLRGVGGGLQVSSEPGAGTEVILVLPSVPAGAKVSAVERKAEDHTGECHGDAVLTGNQISGLRVLVVDDEASVQEMLQEMLVGDDHQATIMTDAVSTLNLFESGSYDLALVDLTLPGMSGRELAGRLRAADPELVIAMISGWGSEELIAGMDTGVVDLVANKPIDLPKLRGLLKQASGGRPREGLSDND